MKMSSCIILTFLLFITACSDSSNNSQIPPVPPYSDINGAGNFHNYGLAVSNGTWTYYSLITFDPDNEEDINGIYKKLSDGSGDDECIYKGIVLDLYLIEGKLYFTEATGEDSEALFRMNVDGTGKVILVNLDEYSFKDICYYEGNFYYILNMAAENETDYGHVYRISKDGGSPVQVGSDNVNTICVGEGWLFYRNSSDLKLYRLSLDGATREKLSDGVVDSVMISHGKLYYINISQNSTAASCNLDGSGAKILYDESVTYINVADDHVYMSKEDVSSQEGTGLFSIRTDGTELKALKANTELHNVPNINFAAGKLYCMNTTEILGAKVPVSYYRINSDGTGYELLWGQLD
jgi:hypothetical protein